MSKQPADLVVEARWLIPVTEPWEIIEAGAIAVGDGRILAIGPAAAVLDRFQPARHLSLPTHTLLPGLVNAHGHAAMSLLRGFAEDVPLQSWLKQRIWPLEARWADRAFVRDGVRLALAEMISRGITCFSDMYFFPETTAEEARLAGVRAQIAFPVIEFANAWSDSTEEAFHKGFDLHDLYRNDPRIRIAFGPHSVYSIATADLDKILTFSEELDANVQIHLHENATELNDCRRLFGMSGIDHLHAHDLLGPRLQAVHMTQISPRELELLAASSVQ
ncbi:MAG: amidohydrolase family protein, partial [Pseudomonadales bacterium]|nr:amidohydrolase family protein [Pseudomonadales bacterium]